MISAPRCSFNLSAIIWSALTSRMSTPRYPCAWPPPCERPVNAADATGGIPDGGVAAPPMARALPDSARPVTNAIGANHLLVLRLICIYLGLLNVARALQRLIRCCADLGILILG